MNDPGSLLDQLRVQGIVTVALVNVDRLERLTLELPNTAIEGPVLEDLVRLILGRESAFLKRGRLAGLRGRPHEV